MERVIDSLPINVVLADPEGRLLYANETALAGIPFPLSEIVGQLAWESPWMPNAETAAIVREEYVDERRLWSLMAAADLVVSLRAPTMGETSGSAIRALSLGRPLVVSDVGWFSELPNDVVLKVPVDEYEVATLEAAIALAADRGSALGANARTYVEREHAVGG